MLYAPRGWARWAPWPPWSHGTPCMSPWEGARGAKGAFRAHRTPGPGTGPPPWPPGAPESSEPSLVPGDLEAGPWGPASRPTWPHGGVLWGQEGTRVPGASADPRGGPGACKAHLEPRGGPCGAPGPSRPTWSPAPSLRGHRGAPQGAGPRPSEVPGMVIYGDPRKLRAPQGPQGNPRALGSMGSMGSRTPGLHVGPHAVDPGEF